MKAVNTAICRKMSGLRQLGNSMFYRNRKNHNISRVCAASFAASHAAAGPEFGVIASFPPAGLLLPKEPARTIVPGDRPPAEGLS
jgi:hypothetical protein